jgi:hypothetical protein
MDSDSWAFVRHLISEGLSSLLLVLLMRPLPKPPADLLFIRSLPVTHRLELKYPSVKRVSFYFPYMSLVTVIRPLSEAEIVKVVKRQVAARDLSPRVQRLVLEKSAGNPVRILPTVAVRSQGNS